MLDFGEVCVAVRGLTARWSIQPTNSSSLEQANLQQDLGAHQGSTKLPKHVLYFAVISILLPSLALPVPKRGGSGQMPKVQKASMEISVFKKNILTVHFHPRDVLQPVSDISSPQRFVLLLVSSADPSVFFAFPSNHIFDTLKIPMLKALLSHKAFHFPTVNIT